MNYKIERISFSNIFCGIMLDIIITGIGIFLFNLSLILHENYINMMIESHKLYQDTIFLVADWSMIPVVIGILLWFSYFIWIIDLINKKEV